MSLSEEQVKAIVREEVRRILDAGLMYTAESKNAPKPKEQKELDTKPQPQEIPIQAQFPEDLEQRLDFAERGDWYVIKPKHFLGGDYFARVSSVVRGLNGEYVSAGKDSHFRVPKR